jgi:hypothetical protein
MSLTDIQRLIHLIVYEKELQGTSFGKIDQ